MVTGIGTTGPLPATLLAVQARLKLVFPETRFIHRVVSAHMNGAAWKQLIGDGRLVGLGFSDLAPRTGTGRLFSGDSKWCVFVAARNQRGVAAAYLGDGQGAGVFAMGEAVAAVLHGWTIPGIGSVSVTSVQSAYADGWDPADNLAMLAITFEVGITITLPDGVAMDAPDALTTIASTWLPADDADTVGPDLITVGTIA